MKREPRKRNLCAGRYLIDVSEVGGKRLRNSSQHSCGSQKPLFCAQEPESTIKNDQLCSKQPGNDGPGYDLLFNEIIRPFVVDGKVVEKIKAEALCTDMRACAT